MATSEAIAQQRARVRSDTSWGVSPRIFSDTAKVSLLKFRVAWPVGFPSTVAFPPVSLTCYVIPGWQCLQWVFPPFYAISFKKVDDMA